MRAESKNGMNNTHTHSQSIVVVWCMVQQTVCPRHLLHLTTSPSLIHCSHLATTMLAAFPKYSRSNTSQHVPTQYQYADLFEFAQSGGKQAFDVVQKMLKTEASVYVHIESTSSVKIHVGDGQAVHWYFCGKRDSKRHDLEDTEQLVVKLNSENSEELTEVSELVFAKTSTSSYCCTLNCTTKVVQFVRYICTLFNATVNELNICPSKLHHLEEIQSVEVLKKSSCVMIRRGTVSHEEMRQILEKFDSVKMKIWCNPGPNFTYDRTISYKTIQIYASSWFQGPMLLNLVNCKTVYLTGSRVSEEHLNIFLHEWLNENTGCGTIHFLGIVSEGQMSGIKDVYEPSCQKEWDLDKIAKGLPSFRQPSSPLWSIWETKRFCRTIDGTIMDVMKRSERVEFCRERQGVAF